MDVLVSIHELINEILLSKTIDEKRIKRNQVITLFKEAELVQSLPVVVKLNTALALQEAIDSFMVHDNCTSRENLNNTYGDLRDLVLNDIKAA